MPSGGDKRILFFYHGLDGSFQYRFLGDDEGRYDPLSVRLINLTNSEVACLLEDERVRVSADSEELRRPSVSVDERFRFTFQLLDAGLMAVRAPVKTLRFIHPDMRLAFVFSFEEREIVDDQGRRQRVYRPQANRLYDLVGGDQ